MTEEINDPENLEAPDPSEFDDGDSLDSKTVEGENQE